jgi:reactive chlorine resistance protein C
MMDRLQTVTLAIGQVVLRYSLVLFFLGFGILKLTPMEAAAIHAPVAHSPFLFWLDAAFGQQGASNVIGVVEIAIALLIAIRPLAPRLSALGGLGAAFALVITLSFLVTTPGLDPALGGFIVKDVTLLGAALWSVGEALTAARQRITNRLAAA